MNYTYEMNNKQVGRFSAVVTPKLADYFACLAHYVFPLDAPELEDAYRAPEDVMFAQCLGLFSSLKMGRNSDSPSPNGASGKVLLFHLNLYT